ncbi:hypothetical protein B0J11DRAFT_462829 [Dendryphion nanum]|uniref:Suppressor of anucleate metulae protein B n=1 Tax=Dendryphion nanum TaxID=256645 RepID=A0A9P9DRH3_9PLEO|nr:hypothetical protein B0J11DRAFT_462829 [Dendryphion nanum]
MLSVSSSVYRSHSKSCIGYGLFSNRSVSSGEEITSVKRPLSVSLDPPRLDDTCANCFVWTGGANGIGSRSYVDKTITVSSCGGCKRVKYCSRVCQKSSWTSPNPGHKHICKVVAPLFGKELPKAVLATMELLIRRQRKLISDDDWTALCQLESHIDDFKQTGQYEGIDLMAMGAGQFSGTSTVFNRDFVASMYGRILTNCLTLITPTLDPLGIIIDPLLCQINHSCDPNAYLMLEGPTVSLRTLRPIEKDEEIYISYIDTTIPFTRRLSELKSRWFFTCKCSKCENGPTLQEDGWAMLPSDLKAREKKMADQVIEKDPDLVNDIANYVGDSEDDRRVAALQGKVFAAYEEEQRETDTKIAIGKIEKAMRLCGQSGLWPAYRQPYAALRDDLIVNLLTAGNYATAWSHSAKRYRYILPKLYPERSHPVRVVQTWQMAMLATYMASEQMAVMPEADMSLIALMLVVEVREMCRASHGEDSAFAKSVRAKWSEMAEEMDRTLGKDAQRIIAEALPRQRDFLKQMGDWVQY